MPEHPVVLDPAALRRAVAAAAAGVRGPAAARAAERATGDYLNAAAPTLPPLRWTRLGDLPPVFAGRADHHPDPAAAAERWRTALGLGPFAPAGLPGARAARGWTAVGLVQIWFVADPDAYENSWRARIRRP